MANKEDNKIVGSGPGSTGRKQDATVAEYWTPERMAAAIPVPMPKEPKGNAPAAETIQPAGEPGKEEPGHPNGSKAESRAQEAEKFQPRTQGGVAVANPLAYPFTTCGKLFFTQGGKDYSGSASVVAPNVLLTAGHCVYLGGWRFTLRIRNVGLLIRTTGFPIRMKLRGRPGRSIATEPMTMALSGSITIRGTRWAGWG